MSGQQNHKYYFWFIFQFSASDLYFNITAISSHSCIQTCNSYCPGTVYYLKQVFGLSLDLKNRHAVLKKKEIRWIFFYFITMFSVFFGIIWIGRLMSKLKSLANNSFLCVAACVITIPKNVARLVSISFLFSWLIFSIQFMETMKKVFLNSFSIILHVGVWLWPGASCLSKSLRGKSSAERTPRFDRCQ